MAATTRNSGGGTSGGSKGRGGASRSRGRRGGTRRRRPAGQESGPPQKFEPDRDARTELLQEQLEAEFEGSPDYGDPLDPEEASADDIAAELSRSRREENETAPDDQSAFEDTSEAVEFGIDGARGGFPDEEGEDAAPSAGDFVHESGESTRPGSTFRARETGQDARGRDSSADRVEAPVSDRSGEGRDRLSRLWNVLIRPRAFPLGDLVREEGGAPGSDRWLFATGKTADGQVAAVVATPNVDSNLLTEGLLFLTQLSRSKGAIKHLFLCAPYFEEEQRKTAYLVDPKKVRLRLVRVPSVDEGTGSSRIVETLRPETRDTSRTFEEILSEVPGPKTRNLLFRFKEVAEGSLVDSGGEGVVCRGRKIYFRMRGEDLIVARPRDNTVLLEILYPRGRTLRLSEKNFDQTLSRVRECFEAARKSPNLPSREGGFRLAVREALETRENGLIPLDAEVSVGPGRLRIDVLAARNDGSPAAVQIRARLSPEDFERSLLAFTALREQGTLLKKLLGDRGGLLNAAGDAELCFVSLNVHEGLPAIAELLVPRVTFFRVTPERRWWEGTLKLTGPGQAIQAAPSAPAAQQSAVQQAPAPPVRTRPERPSFKIEGKNPAVIASHYDRDGVVGNIVLSRAVPNVVAHRFMSSEDLIIFFFTPEVQATLPEIYDLFLTDLRFRPSTRLSPEVKEAFVENLRNFKGNIYWIDHVYWQDFDRREIEGAIGKNNLVISPRERTAGQAVMKALRVRDDFSSQLVEMVLGKLADDPQKAWGKDWINIIDYLRNDLDRIESAMKPLYEGRPEEIDESLRDEGLRKEGEAEAYVASRDFRVVIFGTYKLVVVDLPEKQSFNYTSVTQKVRERYRAQLSITSFGNSETIIIANSFSNRQVVNMIQVKDHLTRKFDWLKPVQGHENVITLKVEGLLENKERLDQALNELVRNRSLFT
ncbi:MAG: hypothetical protein Q8R92_16190 [Deltaproteobacteria bacterium]|nr:hypothetical protein [Deltaproteobacteria bacterium]